MTNRGQDDRRNSTDRGAASDHDQDIERDPVWKLLLEARKPEASPFFARNILREIRRFEESGTTGILAGLKSLFTLPRIAFAAAAVIAVTVILFRTADERNPDIVDNTATTAINSDTEAAPPAEQAAVAVVIDGTASDSSEFDIGDYQEEIQMIDYLDGLLAVQNVEALDDEALAEILF